ncbi:hypothetical protein DEDE109153_16405 [Deinococcus deserti]|uniref:Lipoprotein n=1 Tax=Deinococcus deserti (strain DSM 17065 / CIP 109153 / LMG 22923 / VCD115) TaxID=546414 RepID=X5HLK7_DEIDV|nr:hypothetical protein [Deinococcus deserti]AHX26556.1 hypothetical protein, precursor [Deinococcus deserti VCD115]
MKPGPLLAVILSALLSACAPGGINQLKFQPAPEGARISAPRLLIEQRVPATQLVSVRDAVDRAPVGSLIVVCSERWSAARPWGICTHVTRKLGPDEFTDAPGIFVGGLFGGGPQITPARTLFQRDVVIVLDVGVRNHHLNVLRATARKLAGTPYRVAGLLDRDGGLDCSTYQNELQRAMGLADAVPFNGLWNLYLPQDALTAPGAQVLWVGVRTLPSKP